MYISAALSSFFLLLQIQPKKKNPVDKKKVDVMQLASGKGSQILQNLPVNLIFSVKPLVLFAFMLLLVLPSSPVMPAFVNSYSKFCIFIFYFSLRLFLFLCYFEVPNRRADRNKQASLEKSATLPAYLLSKLINEQGGIFRLLHEKLRAGGKKI